jgi:hypothetical protein
MSMRALHIRHFLCRINDGLQTGPPMRGRALWSTIEYVIPTALLPEKLSYLDTTYAIQDYFGYEMKDTAGSWPAYGCADWGVIGGLIAGLIFGGWLMLMDRVARLFTNRMPMLGMILVGGMLLSLFIAEAEPTYSWLVTRNMAVMWAIAEVLMLFVIPSRPLCTIGEAGRAEPAVLENVNPR